MTNKHEPAGSLMDGYRYAFADPPYLGCGRLYVKHHPDALIWDDPETHRALIARLVAEFPDGWALSCSSPSLRALLPMCPETVRVCAWVKPFASFKPNVNPAYAWEPVILNGGRKRGREEPTIRDWHSANITMQKGLAGAKPYSFASWIFDLLGGWDGDTLDDLFPGTGIIKTAWDIRTHRATQEVLDFDGVAWAYREDET